MSLGDRILEIVKEHGKIGPEELYSQLGEEGKNRRTVIRHCKSLCKEGKLVRVPSFKVKPHFELPTEKSHLNIEPMQFIYDLNKPALVTMEERGEDYSLSLTYFIETPTAKEVQEMVKEGVKEQIEAQFNNEKRNLLTTKEGLEALLKYTVITNFNWTVIRNATLRPQKSEGKI